MQQNHIVTIQAILHNIDVIIAIVKHMLYKCNKVENKKYKT